MIRESMLSTNPGCASSILDFQGVLLRRPLGIEAERLEASWPE